MLLTRAPLYSGLQAVPFSFDLHVLSTPPAFILSQNQTLQLNSLNIFHVLSSTQKTRFIYYVTNQFSKIKTNNLCESKLSVLPKTQRNYITFYLLSKVIFKNMHFFILPCFQLPDQIHTSLDPRASQPHLLISTSSTKQGINPAQNSKSQPDSNPESNFSTFFYQKKSKKSQKKGFQITIAGFLLRWCYFLCNSMIQFFYLE